MTVPFSENICLKYAAGLLPYVKVVDNFEAEYEVRNNVFVSRQCN